MAAALLGQIALGRYAHELERSPEKLSLLMWHKSVGISLLLLALLRLAWNVSGVRPHPVPAGPPWEGLVARVSHFALYALMIAIPLSGWLMNSAKNLPLQLFRLIPWPSLIRPDRQLGEFFAEVHETLVALFIALLLVHASAALWHHLVRKDRVLLRMLQG